MSMVNMEFDQGLDAFKDRFKIVRGITASNVGDAVSINFPTNWVKEYTIVIGFMLYTGGTYRANGVIGNTIVASVDLSNKIYVTTRDASGAEKDYKILLYNMA